MRQYDKSMMRVKDIMEKRGLTLEQVGLLMGYPRSHARQAVWQFLRSWDPQISMLRRFADAMGSFCKDMLKPMPMIMEQPPPQPFRIFMDHTPVIRTPMSVVISSFDCGGALPDDGWKFVYLFPLGKRAYARRK